MAMLQCAFNSCMHIVDAALRGGNRDQHIKRSNYIVAAAWLDEQLNAQQAGVQAAKASGQRWSGMGLTALISKTMYTVAPVIRFQVVTLQNR